MNGMQKAFHSPTPGAAASEQSVAADAVELRHTQSVKLWTLAIGGVGLLLVMFNNLWPSLTKHDWVDWAYIGMCVAHFFVIWKGITLHVVRADDAGLTVGGLWSGAQLVRWDEVASFSVEMEARDKTASSCVVTMRTRRLLKIVGGGEAMTVLPTGRGHHLLKLKLNFGPPAERLKLQKFIEARLQEHGAQRV